ncbi:GGDEF domain-containing protein [Maledivibacter halophilus]|uniref:Diguanylate cyclase (GGDEF) domain-containing protein n=1 Tax=Maledivibacter halophilus TaxID=36842 RepID=A0A1T5I8Z0_9FIRM|nr:GGDEF domain-containing protein [Maledivibacter halophilus]SKC35518.1 diguanylate cyclase (GGDEF) domain-containing protein [Maledivibacter halophilus]
MIKSVSDIMVNNFKNVNVLDGVKKAQDFVINKGIDFFPVMEEGRLVGMLTYRDLIRVHPNRIVADAMENKVISISPCTSIWEARSVFNSEDVEVLLIVGNEKIKGIVTKTLVNTELAKCEDPLTGLYKSDYIYYRTKELINNKKNPAVIFIDINDFGYIDKKYGHIQGDILLKEVALILKECMTSETFLCRFGGDEFTIVAPYYLEKCIEFTKKILNEISAFQFSNRIEIRASAGIALDNNKDCCTDINSRVYELINKASLASTKAKNEKNSYYIAGNDDINEVYQIG